MAPDDSHARAKEQKIAGAHRAWWPARKVGSPPSDAGALGDSVAFQEAAETPADVAEGPEEQESPGAREEDLGDFQEAREDGSEAGSEQDEVESVAVRAQGFGGRRWAS